MNKISLTFGIAVLSLSINAHSENLNASIPLAGTINLAVLNTTVDKATSDHTLIEATITDGKYKGAKLNGELVSEQGSPKNGLSENKN